MPNTGNEISSTAITSTKLASDLPMNTAERETGAAIQKLLTSPPSVEPYEPAIVGGTREIVLGKKSGRYSIIESLRRLGMTAKEEEIEAALPLIKDLSVANRRLITDDEFIGIMRQVAQA